jgi:hypothetical protein
MGAIARNLAICGAAVLFILIISGAVFLQQTHSESEGTAARKQAVIDEAVAIVQQQAESDAREQLASGDFVLLAAAHGWGPDEIPGLEFQLWESCYSSFTELRVYREYGDVIRLGSDVNPVQEFREHPRETHTYAERFNQVIFSALRELGQVKCN